MIVLFNKPFNVLSQFRDREGRATLGDYIPVPGIHPAGRLDRDSEGLMILTDDGRLQSRITQPRHKMAKRYWVQLERIPQPAALRAFASGLKLKDGVTAPATIRRIDPPAVWPRNPPIRERKRVPDCWVEVTLREGRNRQIRRMTAAIGHPTLRLIRVAIGPWELGGLRPGSGGGRGLG